MKNALHKAFTGAVAVLTIVWSVGLANLPMTANAATAGDLIKGTTLSTVYYYAGDGSRYAFPNEKTYFTWYSDFSDVTTLSDSALAAIPLASENVVYRPGSRWIKVDSDPKTYAVSSEGTIRWIESEEVAEGLAGTDWSSMIDDVPVSYFGDYTLGTSLMAAEAFEGALVSDGTSTYLISGTEMRLVSSAGMTANRYQTRSVLDGSGFSLTGYTAGTGVTAEEAELVDTAQQGGVVADEEGGLSVSLASTTPASSTIPDGADSVPFTTFKLTATDGDVTVSQMLVKYGGVASTSNVGNVYLYEGNTRLTNGRSINSTTRLVTFSSLDLEIADGTSKYLTVRADTSYVASDSAYFSLVEADDVVTDSDVSGNFPISGNSMTFSDTDAGNLVVTNGGSVSNPTIGEDQATIGKFKFTADTEGASLYQVAFNVNQAADHSNFKLYDGSTELGSGTVSGDIVTFALSTPYAIAKGANETLTLKADVAGDASDTLTVYIEEATDVMATGDIYGFNMDITITAVDTAAEGFSLTLQGGDLTFAFNGPTASDIAIDSNDVVLMNLTITAANWTELQHLPIIFSSTTGDDTTADVDDLLNSSDSSANYTDLTVRLEDGTVWMGPEELSTTNAAAVSAEDQDQTITFDDYQTLQAGESVDVMITVDVADNSNAAFADSDTVAATLDVSLITADDINGDSLSSSNITPGADLTGYNMSIVSSSLTVSVASTPSASTYVKGTSNVEMVGYSFAAGDSSDVVVTEMIFSAAGDTDATFTANVNENDVAVRDYVSSCSVYDSITGSLIDGPEGLTAATVDTVTFNNFRWTIEAGETSKAVLKCNLANIVPMDSNDDAYSFFITDNDDVTSEDSEGDDITETLSAVTIADVSTISTMTVTTSGSLTTVIASDSPTATIVLGSSTDVTVAKFKVTATNEAFTVTKVTLDNTGSTDIGVASVKISYTNSAGATETKTGYLSSTEVVFSNMDMYVEKGTSAYLTAMVNTAVVDSTTIDGSTMTLVLDTTNAADFEAIGVGSGATLSGTDVADATPASMTLYKTKPTLSLASGSPSGAGIPGLNEVFRFNIAVDSRGYVTLNEVTFKMSSTSGSATDWNECDTANTGVGIDETDLTLYDMADMGTALDVDADWTMYDSADATAVCTNLADDIDYIVLDLTTADVIAAGSTVTYALYMDTTGASAANDDSLRIDLDTNANSATGSAFHDGTDGTICWDDDAYDTGLYASLVRTLPVTGGTIIY